VTYTVPEVTGSGDVTMPAASSDDLSSVVAGSGVVAMITSASGATTPFGLVDFTRFVDDRGFADGMFSSLADTELELDTSICSDDM
jgi:hypothetical protein